MHENVSAIWNVLELLIPVGYIAYQIIIRARRHDPFISRD